MRVALYTGINEGWIIYWDQWLDYILGSMVGLYTGINGWIIYWDQWLDRGLDGTASASLSGACMGLTHVPVSHHNVIKQVIIIIIINVIIIIIIIIIIISILVFIVNIIITLSNKFH